MRIGTAVNRNFYLPDAGDTTYRSLLAREFSVLTPENDLKFVRLRPSRHEFAFEHADSMVAFAEMHGMQVRGHTLVWHRQLAPWLEEASWTPEEAKTLLAEHIAEVVGRYRGRLVAWDVVNEAISDSASLRSTFWSERIGPEYIELAFRWAHEADPEVDLFYNDYGIAWMNAKSDAVYTLVRDLLSRGVPVHGIGFQMHFEVGNVPSREELAENFARFAALGLKIHVTELDVRLPQPATTEHLQAQAESYRRVVEVCLQTEACEMIVTWGFTDRSSWIPRHFEGWGDALLFDKEYRPKPAYAEMRRALSGM